MDPGRIRSRRCWSSRGGKTTVLKLLGALACQPLAAVTLTPAVLYRVVEAYAPTILVDEADTFLAENDELRGVLNAGHDRHSAVVPRCVGDEFEPRVFHVFGAVAIAAIGKLPDTLMDRSIVIEMKRKAPGEKVRKLRRRQREALAALPRRCARWVADNLKSLSDSEPEVPDDLDDRAADNWEPLLAIADQAGGPWPLRARATAIHFSGERGDAVETGDTGVQLLADVRAVFADTGIDKSTTKALLAALAELEGRPWAEWNRGRGLTARQLGALLRRFGIKPGTIRVGNATPKGYLLADLSDAFGRYLPDPRITMEFYAHLAPGYLRNAIERLAINPAEPEVQTNKVAAFAAPLLQPSGDHEISERRESEKQPVFADLEESGISGSNRRHSAWEADALPTELIPRKDDVWRDLLDASRGQSDCLVPRPWGA
jgi:putative DNA primase/helicase